MCSLALLDAELAFVAQGLANALIPYLPIQTSSTSIGDIDIDF